MTREAFKCHCENTLGLTKEEWEPWWGEFLDNPDIERDEKGFRGRQQLWIPNAHMNRSREKRTGVTDEVNTGQNPIKKPEEHDVEVLKDHVHNQNRGFGDDFIRKAHGDRTQLNAALTKASPCKRSAEHSKDPKETAGGPEASPSKRTRTRKISCVERDAPKLFKAMSQDVKKFEKLEETAVQKFFKAVVELMRIPEAEKRADPALMSYTRTLQFRAQLFMKWLDNTYIVKLFDTFNPELPDKCDVEGFDVMHMLPDNTSFGYREPAAGQPASSSSGSSLDGLALTDGYIKTATMTQLLKGNPARKPFKEPIEAACTKASLNADTHEVFNQQTIKDLQKFMKMWDEKISAATDLLNATIQSSTDVQVHSSGKRKEKQRDASKAQKDKQSAALAEVREEAKRQAEAIRLKHAPPTEKTLHPVFQAEWSEVGMPEVVVHNVRPPQDNMYDEPFLVRDSEQVKLCLGNDDVQKGLMQFAAKYKKEKTIKDTGRGQEPIQEKQGKSVVQDIFVIIIIIIIVYHYDYYYYYCHYCY